MQLGGGGGGGVLYHYRNDLKRNAHALSGDAGADLQVRQASRGAPTTASSQALSEGDFSYDVHPFRFPSATGLTPKLITARAARGVLDEVALVEHERHDMAAVAA